MADQSAPELAKHLRNRRFCAVLVNGQRLLKLKLDVLAGLKLWALLSLNSQLIWETWQLELFFSELRYAEWELDRRLWGLSLLATLGSKVKVWTGVIFKADRKWTKLDFKEEEVGVDCWDSILGAKAEFNSWVFSLATCLHLAYFVKWAQWGQEGKNSIILRVYSVLLRQKTPKIMSMDESLTPHFFKNSFLTQTSLP